MEPIYVSTLEKTKMVPNYLLGQIKDTLSEVIFNVEMDADKLESVSKLVSACSYLDNLMAFSPDVPLEIIPGKGKGDLVKAMGLDRGIDYSLPQGLVDTCHTMLGVDICPHFVMDCRKSPFYLLTVTAIGRFLVPAIYSRVFNTEVPEYYTEILKK